ncbi:MAG: Mu-like prophage major head subunit gpT family protein [Deltaproteobacteria bacterium]|nr:Mu-like prophage major head subunit gpT family protein [Deltaproteobacteria bacterium]
MIINQEALARLYTGFTAVFNAAFQETQTWYEQVAMTVPANTRIMDYKFLLDFPMVREWIGDRQISSLEPKAFQVESKDWEATIEVDRNDIEDDQLGLYNPIISALAQEARKHPERLIADLLKGGFTTTCYDGRNFFATDHQVGDTTVANFAGGTEAAWYLLDTSRAVKPFIFQLRREVQLVRMDRQDDEHAFMRKKLRYGVDYRGAAAFGLWQLAYASKGTLTAANYAAARAAMMSMKNADGRPLGLKPNLMLVPPSLEAEAREILQAQFIIGDPTSGGAKTNIWQGTADLLVIPGLT